MSYFRKKPVVVEAKQAGNDYDEDCAILGWCGGRLPDDPEDSTALFHIDTLEGTMNVEPGDWVIRGVMGEFYPCKPDIFDVTYEPTLPLRGHRMTDDEVIDALWAEMPAEQVKILRAEQPEVVERAQLAHHNVWHSTTHEAQMMASPSEDTK